MPSLKLTATNIGAETIFLSGYLSFRESTYVYDKNIQVVQQSFGIFSEKWLQISIARAPLLVENSVGLLGFSRRILSPFSGVGIFFERAKW